MNFHLLIAIVLICSQVKDPKKRRMEVNGTNHPNKRQNMYVQGASWVLIDFV